MADDVNKEWIETTERFIGFIDIMGFKDMVYRENPADLREVLMGIPRAMEEYENIPGVNGPNYRFSMFSDSIIVFSRDKSCFDDFHSVMYYLFNQLFFMSIPFKGSIAFGEITTNFEKSIFFGRPLIDAYLLQEELLLYGIVVHGSAQKHISEINKDFILYLTPFKGGVAKHYLLNTLDGLAELNKLLGNQKDYGLERLTKLERGLDKMRLITSGSLRKYIDNTEVFFKYCYKGIEQ